MAGVMQVSSGGDQVQKPGGAAIEVLLKPSGGVTSAGKGLEVEAKRSGAPVWECWGLAYALLVTTPHLGPLPPEHIRGEDARCPCAACTQLQK